MFITTASILCSVYIIATGIGGPLGMGLIAMGTSSLVSGFMNEANGGSFFAGWAGGQLSGAASMIPYVGAPIGAFFGSVLTDFIDTKGRGINWGKAGWSALAAWVFDTPAIAYSQYFGSEMTKAVQFAFSYRGALIGVINGFFDWLLGRKFNEKAKKLCF